MAHLSNLGLCYEGIQRVYRNAIVAHIRSRLNQAFPGQAIEKAKRPFAKEWDNIKAAAQQRRATGELQAPLTDEIDVLGVNHFFNLFETYWSELAPADDGRGESKVQKEALLRWIKTVKALRDPLSHPGETDLPYNDAFVLLDAADRVLRQLGQRDAAEKVQSLANQLGGRPGSEPVSGAAKVSAPHSAVPESSPLHAAVARLNKSFDGHARILALPRHPLRLRNEGPLEPSPEIAAAAALDIPKQNDCHAVLAGDLETSTEPIEIGYRVTDFAVIRALREQGMRPRILSACTVAVDEAQRLLVFHRRSAGSATYPDRLHTVGGAMQPRQDGRGEHTLERTMLREFSEETDFWPAEAPCPIMLTEETRTGFIQCVFLGVAVRATWSEETYEGMAIRVGFDSLSDLLRRPIDWVPSGYLHVLVWLGAGAPGAQDARFNGEDAHALFDRLVATRLGPFGDP